MQYVHCALRFSEGANEANANNNFDECSTVQLAYKTLRSELLRLARLVVAHFRCYFCCLIFIDFYKCCYCVALKGLGKQGSVGAFSRKIRQNARVKKVQKARSGCQKLKINQQSIGVIHMSLGLTVQSGQLLLVAKELLLNQETSHCYNCFQTSTTCR